MLADQHHPNTMAPQRLTNAGMGTSSSRRETEADSRHCDSPNQAEPVGPTRCRRRCPNHSHKHSARRCQLRLRGKRMHATGMALSLRVGAAGNRRQSRSATAKTGRILPERSGKGNCRTVTQKSLAALPTLAPRLNCSWNRSPSLPALPKLSEPMLSLGQLETDRNFVECGQHVETRSQVTEASNFKPTCPKAQNIS